MPNTTRWYIRCIWGPAREQRIWPIRQVGVSDSGMLPILGMDSGDGLEPQFGVRPRAVERHSSGVDVAYAALKKLFDTWGGEIGGSINR